MTKVVRYGGATATSPGKHGPLDWRVTFAGRPPTHGELVFMVGMVLIAEDRYNGRRDLGRYLLWSYLDLLWCHKTPERVVELAGATDEVKRDWGRS